MVPGFLRAVEDNNDGTDFSPGNFLDNEKTLGSRAGSSCRYHQEILLISHGLGDFHD